ncbi:hypothetical protein IPJ63_01280 [Candidatus Nomurabacteria bacterium]|nr:MAG: hypothetical protein IPJ63_01280 [Candidatus Nomurabacteria bacterium]
MNEFNENNPINKKSGPENKDYWWSKKIDSLPYENPEMYIHRVSEYISSAVLISKINLGGKDEEELEDNWDIIEPLIWEEVKRIESRTPEKMPLMLLNQELRHLNESIVQMSNPIDDLDKIKDREEYFDRTEINRDFSKEVSGKKRPLIESLFDLGSLNEEHKKEILKKTLDNKKIILLGGGDSINDLITESDIKPASVVNIDSFIKFEDKEKNQRKNYSSIVLGAESEEIKNLKIEKADEIWATWSVPMYLETAKDIENLFENIDYLLVLNGVLRIHPLYLLDFKKDGHEMFDRAEKFENRKSAWIKAVSNLLKTDRYNMYIMNNSTMFLQKISE